MHLVSSTATDFNSYASINMIKTLAILFALVSPLTMALDFEPYQTARITAAQWEDYYLSVRGNYRDTEQVHADRYLVTYSDDSARMSVTFTLAGHEAHPAWITRKIVEQGGIIELTQTGYFAGNERSFAELFEEYERLNQRIRSSFQDK